MQATALRAFRHLALRGAAILLPVLVLGVGAISTAPVQAQSTTTVLVSQDPNLGSIFTDSNGMTLYIHTTDSAGMSTCSGMCATAWPAFQPPSTDLTLPAGVGGSLGVITRDDGAQQVTYNGMPLYYWFKDMSPGDVTGQGINNFMAAQPQALAESQGPVTGPTVMIAQDPTLGAILTDSNGMTLYTRASDTAGMSSCSGMCATVWPPFQPPAGDLVLPADATGMLGVITRADGTQQVTYNGMPLYYFAKDMNPGDVNGQGIGGFTAAMP